MDQECQELCPYEDVCCPERCLWEEVTVQDVQQWEEEDTFQEIAPCGAVVEQKVHHWKVGATVEWPDGTQQELSRYGERVTVQDDCLVDDGCREVSLWEEEVEGPRLCPWATCVPEPCQWDDDDDDICPELMRCCALSPCPEPSPCCVLSPCPDLPPCRPVTPACVLPRCRAVSPPCVLPPCRAVTPPCVLPPCRVVSPPCVLPPCRVVPPPCVLPPCRAVSPCLEMPPPCVLPACCGVPPSCALPQCRVVSPSSVLPPCRPVSPSCVLSPCRPLSPWPDPVVNRCPVDEDVQIHFCQTEKYKKEPEEKDCSALGKNKEAQQGAAEGEKAPGSPKAKEPGSNQEVPEKEGSAETGGAGTQGEAPAEQQ